MSQFAPAESSFPHVLIVDDENAICEMLSRYLSKNGFRTTVANSGTSMMARLEREPYDLILLDLNLGAEDGLDYLRALNGRRRSPVIVISGRKNPVDRIIGLELGADDYVCKPFHLREVLARAKKALRHTAAVQDVRGCEEDDTVLSFDGWKVHLERRQVISPSGCDVELTGGEFKLLSVFIKNPGRVLSRQQLMDVTHGAGWHAYERTIDAQISRLRKKIEVDPKRPKLIKSVHGDGYVFTPNVLRLAAPKHGFLGDGAIMNREPA
ncbi:MAG TPA: response regulator transcription factor [Pseudolabrys sp.]|nr:response regulator transcription factor [Pseudolabrys sp.]